MTKKDQETRIFELTSTLDTLREQHNQQIADMDREKIQTQEQLKSEMEKKIKQTKSKLMALNDEQLHTTARLTILEN